MEATTTYSCNPMKPLTMATLKSAISEMGKIEKPKEELMALRVGLKTLGHIKEDYKEDVSVNPVNEYGMLKYLGTVDIFLDKRYKNIFKALIRDNKKNIISWRTYKLEK